MTIETRLNGDKITAEWFNSIKDNLEYSAAVANYLEVTADYLVDMREANIGINASANPVTVTLPTAVGNNGKKINIKSLDVTNAAVIDDADANTLLTFAGTEEVAVYVSDGTVWQLFSNLADLNALETQVNTNTTNIGTNATDITTNAANLTTHEGDYEGHREFDTIAALTTFASTAANGTYCFATDEKKSYQVVDSALVEIGGGTGGISAWVSGTSYVVGDQVYYTDNNVYRCTIDNSDVTFTPANWQELSAGVVDHNDLINIQGGTTGERYHLTNAQNTNVANDNYGKQTLVADGTILNVAQVELDGTSATVNGTLPLYSSFLGKSISVYSSNLDNECKLTGTFVDGSTEYVFKATNTPLVLTTTDDGWAVVAKSNFVDILDKQFIHYKQFLSRSSGFVRLKLEDRNEGDNLLAVDNTLYTKMTANRDDIDIVMSISGARSGDEAIIKAAVYNSSNTLLTRTSQRTRSSSNYATATLNYKMMKGDYLVYEAGDDLIDSSDLVMLVHATAKDARVAYTTDAKIQTYEIKQAANAMTNRGGGTFMEFNLGTATIAETGNADMYTVTSDVGKTTVTALKEIAGNISFSGFIVSAGVGYDIYKDGVAILEGARINVGPRPSSTTTPFHLNVGQKITVYSNGGVSNDANLVYMNVSAMPVTISETILKQQVNRSSDEKVIGTWIDGSTLYEKTFSLTGLSTAVFQTVDATLTNANATMRDGWQTMTDSSQWRTPMYATSGLQIRLVCNTLGLQVYIDGGTATDFTIQYTRN